MQIKNKNSMEKHSTKILQDYIRYSRYAKYIESEQRRETWSEQVARVANMHKKRYSKESKNWNSFKSNCKCL